MSKFTAGVITGVVGVVAALAAVMILVPDDYDDPSFSGHEYH